MHAHKISRPIRWTTAGAFVSSAIKAPNGTGFAVALRDRDAYRLEIVNLHGRIERDLGRIGSPTFTFGRGGRTLWVAQGPSRNSEGSEATGKWSLAAIDVRAGRRRTIVVGMFWPTFALSPDGSQIAYLRMTPSEVAARAIPVPMLWVHETHLSARSERVISRSIGVLGTGGWSRTGNTLAFLGLPLEGTPAPAYGAFLYLWQHGRQQDLSRGKRLVTILHSLGWLENGTLGLVWYDGPRLGEFGKPILAGSLNVRNGRLRPIADLRALFNGHGYSRIAQVAWSRFGGAVIVLLGRGDATDRERALYIPPTGRGVVEIATGRKISAEWSPDDRSAVICVDGRLGIWAPESKIRWVSLHW